MSRIKLMVEAYLNEVFGLSHEEKFRTGGEHFRNGKPRQSSDPVYNAGYSQEAQLAGWRGDGSVPEDPTARGRYVDGEQKRSNYIEMTKALHDARTGDVHHDTALANQGEWSHTGYAKHLIDNGTDPGSEEFHDALNRFKSGNEKANQIKSQFDTRLN